MFFAQKEVHYVSAAVVSPDAAKIEVVSLYPVATNVKQFLGLDNYYWRFVPDYSKSAEPLHKLLTEGNTHS